MELKNIVSIETLKKLLENLNLEDRLNTLSKELKEFTQTEISTSKVSIQKWIPAVTTESDLPVKYQGDFKKGWSYLCRVLTGENADKVFQMVPDSEGNITEWKVYALNKDWVDPSEFEKRIGYAYTDTKSVSGYIADLKHILSSDLETTNQNIEKVQQIINNISGKLKTEIDSLINSNDIQNNTLQELEQRIRGNTAWISGISISYVSKENFQYWTNIINNIQQSISDDPLKGKSLEVSKSPNFGLIFNENEGFCIKNKENILQVMPSGETIFGNKIKIKEITNKKLFKNWTNKSIKNIVLEELPEANKNEYSTLFKKCNFQKAYSNLIDNNNEKIDKVIINFKNDDQYGYLFCAVKWEYKAPGFNGSTHEHDLPVFIWRKVSFQQRTMSITIIRNGVSTTYSRIENHDDPYSDLFLKQYNGIHLWPEENWPERLGHEQYFHIHAEYLEDVPSHISSKIIQKYPNFPPLTRNTVYKNIGKGETDLEGNIIENFEMPTNPEILDTKLELENPIPPIQLFEYEQSYSLECSNLPKKKPNQPNIVWVDNGVLKLS